MEHLDELNERIIEQRENYEIEFKKSKKRHRQENPYLFKKPSGFYLSTHALLFRIYTSKRLPNSEHIEVTIKYRIVTVIQTPNVRFAADLSAIVNDFSKEIKNDWGKQSLSPPPNIDYT